MPELPDLEIIRKILNNQILEQKIERVEVLQPLVFRCDLDKLISELEGKKFIRVNRRGKFLLFALNTGMTLAINLMLTGRLQLCSSEEKLKYRTCLRLYFPKGRELRYFDDQLMGKVYMVSGEDFFTIPQFATLGPEPLEETLTFEVFRQRFRRHRGMVKNVLTNQKFLAGIGNAYADEILFAAGIYPSRKSSTLSCEEVEKLYQATRSVLLNAMEIISQRVHPNNIDQKIRDFLQVHGKGGQPCPRCGTRISELRPNRRLTNFCRNCQKQNIKSEFLFH